MLLTSDPLAAYRNAIAQIESAGSGDYAAVGPTHPKLGRALGRYQVMEANIGPWSQAALGRKVSADEFMANPQIQDQIFNHRFGQYVDRFGPEGAAQAWFGGAGGVGQLNRRDSLGTTIGAYTDKFNRALGNNTSASTSGQGGSMRQFNASNPNEEIVMHSGMNERPRGLIGRIRGLLDDPEFMENAAMAFNTLRMRPDPNLARSIEADRQRRGQEAERSAASSAQMEITEQALGWLQANGAPPELIQGVAMGVIPPQDAVNMVLSQMNQGPADPINMAPGNTLFDPTTGQPIFTAPERDGSDPTGIREYEFYAQQEAAAGREPMPFGEWDLARRRSGGVNVNVNTGPDGIDYGSPPANHAWARNDDSTVKLDDRGAPIALPVGPALRQEEQQAAEAETRGRSRATTAATLIDEVAGTMGLREALGWNPETGEYGDIGIASARIRKIIADNPEGVVARAYAGTPTYDFIRTLESLADTIGIERLLEIKESGAGLGAVPAEQLRQLARALGALNAGLSDDLLRKNIDRIRTLYEDILRRSIADANDPTFRGLVSDFSPYIADLLADDQEESLDRILERY